MLFSKANGIQTYCSGVSYVTFDSWWKFQQVGQFMCSAARRRTVQSAGRLHGEFQSQKAARKLKSNFSSRAQAEESNFRKLPESWKKSKVTFVSWLKVEKSQKATYKSWLPQGFNFSRGGRTYHPSQQYL